jgi:hypothetical protein
LTNACVRRFAAGIGSAVCAVLCFLSFRDGNQDAGTMYLEIAVFAGGFSILLFHFARTAYHSRDPEGGNHGQ